MRYGTPSRPAHRATSDGGLALLVRGSGATGQHRPASPAHSHARTGPAPRRSRRRALLEPLRPLQLLTKGIAAVILIALAGMMGFLVLADDLRGRDRPAAAAADLIGSRASDTAPLTMDEVFGDRREVLPEGAAGPYLITTTHADAQCDTATTGEVGPLLAEHGCTEVVRAGLTAPYGGYRVTAGVFNLADAAGAAEVDDRLRVLVEGGDGGFATIPGDAEAEPATAQIGWHARGHYLLYCVITRGDGELVRSDDPYAAQITADLVDMHLGEAVVGRRATSA